MLVVLCRVAHPGEKQRADVCAVSFAGLPQQRYQLADDCKPLGHEHVPVFDRCGGPGGCDVPLARSQPGLTRPGARPGAYDGYRSCSAAGRFRTAPRMPRRISSGGGGQPGTIASTGITLDTLPRLA